MLFPPPGGATEYIAYISAIHGFCPSYDKPGYLYPGSYAVRTKSQINRQHFTSLKRELALPSTGSWLPSRLSST